jgi:succinate dehydrogenase / fumarate reductase cytochrome b subunit
MARHARPLSPFLHYRWQYSNTTSILHRVTGVLLSLGFFLLVYWLAAAAAGPERYASAMRVMGSWLGQAVLLGAVLAFCYHLLNGIRHLFFDAGRGFERPAARKSGWAVGVGSIVLGLLAWYALRASLGGGA